MTTLPECLEKLWSKGAGRTIVEEAFDALRKAGWHDPKECPHIISEFKDVAKSVSYDIWASAHPNLVLWLKEQGFVYAKELDKGQLLKNGWLSPEEMKKKVETLKALVAYIQHDLTDAQLLEVEECIERVFNDGGKK